MTPERQRIKALILQGWRTPEIVQEIKTLRSSTVRIYAHEIRKKLSPTELQTAEQAQAEHVSGARGNYHVRFEHRKVLGPAHVRIGSRLAFARQKSEMSLTEFARFYEFGNALMVSEMEQGFYDFTLAQIGQIAEIVGTTLEELISPPNSEAVHATKDPGLLSPSPDTPHAAASEAPS